MKRILTPIIPVLLALSAFTGCSRSLPDSNRGIINTTAIDESFPGLTRILASDILTGSVVIVNPKLKVADNYARAQVTVQNLTANRYELEYQYQWEDYQGNTVGTPRPWQRFVLGPNQLKTFAETSLTREGQKTTFTLRLVDDLFIEMNRQYGY